MYHTCLRIVNNNTDAEDILQEAFLEAFTTLDKLRNKDAFAGWLKRIVINRSINYISRTKEKWLELEEGDANMHFEETIIDEQAFQLQVDAIKEAIDQLPDKYRTVINLHLFEKMSFEEIAALAEQPSSTIRSQYLRGRQKILTMINKIAEHGE